MSFLVSIVAEITDNVPTVTSESGTLRRSGRKSITELATGDRDANNTSKMAITEIADELAAAYSSEDVEQYFENDLHER